MAGAPIHHCWTVQSFEPQGSAQEAQEATVCSCEASAPVQRAGGPGSRGLHLGSIGTHAARRRARKPGPAAGEHWHPCGVQEGQEATASIWRGWASM